MHNGNRAESLKARLDCRSTLLHDADDINKLIENFVISNPFRVIFPVHIAHLIITTYYNIGRLQDRPRRSYLFMLLKQSK